MAIMPIERGKIREYATATSAARWRGLACARLFR